MQFKTEREAAIQSIKVADYMINVTYKSLSDTKLLLNVVEHVNNAFTKICNWLVYYQREYKQVPSLTKIGTFQAFLEAAKKYNFDKSLIRSMCEVKEVSKLHRESPVEFKRRDCYVICNKDYDTKVVKLRDIQKYISDTKRLMLLVDRLTNE